MLHFDEMTLQELVCPEGYACACGKKHVCAMDFLEIGPGAIRKAPDMVRAMGSKKPFIVCDQNTYEAAGRRVDVLLTEAGIDHKLYIKDERGKRDVRSFEPTKVSPNATFTGVVYFDGEGLSSVIYEPHWLVSSQNQYIYFDL